MLKALKYEIVVDGEVSGSALAIEIQEVLNNSALDPKYGDGIVRYYNLVTGRDVTESSIVVQFEAYFPTESSRIAAATQVSSIVSNKYVANVVRDGVFQVHDCLCDESNPSPCVWEEV